MERILEKLVGSASDETSVEASGRHNADLDLTENDMNDVMKVLTGMDDYNEAMNAGENGSTKELEETFTSVQDMAKVVDKATLANEKFLELNQHQGDLERRYHALSRRINKLRCLAMGTHITDELNNFRDYCDKVAPPLPPPQPPAAPVLPPPKLPNNFNLGSLKPLNMPDGVVLPSVPHGQSPVVQLPTQPLQFPLPTAPDIKVKEEIDNEIANGLINSSGNKTSSTSNNSTTPKLPPPSFEEKQKVDEVLGQLNSNLKHIMDDYDSEATESSSGGESCDEQDNFSNRSDKLAPIKKRAKWTWLNNRASIASKWTWLTAQISDLEYRIRQQTDFYRQIRAAKGAVTLGEPTTSWPAHAKKPVVNDPGIEVPLSFKPPTRNYSRVDSMGRKILIKELAPMAISPEELQAAANQNDDTFTACRTKPIKTLRRRRILGTLGLHRTSTRAAKESTVKCDCIRPTQWCAICFGRSNHILTPDPTSQDKSRTAALLDHSYHQVLSSKPADIPLDLLMMQMIKNQSWKVSAQPKKTEPVDEKKKLKKLKKLTKEELLDNKNKRKLKRRESEGSSVNNMSSKKKIKIRHDKYRRKSVTVHHHHEGHASMIDIASDDAIDASPLPSPLVGSHHQLAEQIRKKRETAFDIDNIVIPYSIAASTRVEKLKYKEILTPTWRMVEDGVVVSSAGDLSNLSSNSSSVQTTPIAAVITATTSTPTSSTTTTPQETPKKIPTIIPVKKPTRRTSKKSLSEESSSSAAAASAMSTISAEDALAAASAAVATVAEFQSFAEDISESSYLIRHSKAEVEEQKRWSKPLKVIGMGSAPNRNRSSRRQNSQADNSGYNTPDPMSPGSVERLDTLEVNTRPSSPDADHPQSIKNRRRTSSTTKSRDRNPSEDAQSSRCTTPGAEQQLAISHQNSNTLVDPFEPRKFPLTDDEFEKMQEEMPSGYDQPPDNEDGGGGIHGGGAGGGSHGEAAGDLESLTDHNTVNNPSSRRPSSQDSSTFEDEANEEEEEDPDWSGDMEDPDDPEWTGGREDAVASSGAGSGPSTSSAQKGQKKTPHQVQQQHHHHPQIQQQPPQPPPQK